MPDDLSYTPPMQPPPTTLLQPLHDATRRYLRRNAYLSIDRYDGGMPKAWFFAVLAILVWFKFQILASYAVAWTGWALDPSVFADVVGPGSGIAATAPKTPFQDNLNLHGWPWQFFTRMHGMTGIALWAVCLVPLFTAKGDTLHRRFGRAFVFFWLLHLLDGLVNSSHTMTTRGFDPTHYLDSIQQGFSLYLYVQFGFIAMVVIDFLTHSLAVIQYKNGIKGPLRGLMLAMPIASVLQGLAMTLWALDLFVMDREPATGKTVEFAIVYLVQCPAYVYLLSKNIRWYLQDNPPHWVQGWVTEHQRNMMFCVAVSLYTGMANITMKYAPWLTAPMFASIDFGFIAWMLIKERAIRGAVLQSRMAISLVASLHRTPAPTAVTGDTTQVNWLLKRFDKDQSGTLDTQEIAALLEEQGIYLSDAEHTQIMNKIDQNGDGEVDANEFAQFFSSWILTEPAEDDALALAFHSLDTNGDGRVSLAELHKALGSGNLSDESIDAALRFGDIDRNGCLDWREFLSALQANARDPAAVRRMSGPGGRR